MSLCVRCVCALCVSVCMCVRGGRGLTSWTQNAFTQTTPTLGEPSLWNQAPPLEEPGSTVGRTRLHHWKNQAPPLEEPGSSIRRTRLHHWKNQAPPLEEAVGWFPASAPSRFCPPGICVDHVCLNNVSGSGNRTVAVLSITS